jgi:hypothetical protein
MPADKRGPMLKREEALMSGPGPNLKFVNLISKLHQI